MVYHDPSWDWRSFGLERDSAKANAIDRDVDDLDPHLAAFAKHGGKLLIYHGWADQQVAPGASIEFYKSVVSLSGDPAESSNWIRLFMAPGMAHCSGGEGPDTFDKISLIEQWVEQGTAPTQIVAAHHNAASQVDRTRPLCPLSSSRSLQRRRQQRRRIQFHLQFEPLMRPLSESRFLMSCRRTDVGGCCKIGGR